MNAYLPVQLPSRCRTYPDVDPDSIAVRPYTGEDEIILAQINPTNIERNFMTILNRVVQGVDPKILTLGDRLYLIIWEFINSYSDSMKINQTCSFCLEEAEFVVDLRKFPIQYLNESIEIPTPVELPISGETVYLRPLTVADEVAVEKLVVGGTETHLYRFARSFVNVDNPIEQMEKMRSWHVKDVARVRYYHSVEIDHGPVTIGKVPCPKCKAEEEIEVPFRFDFFYPTGSTLGTCFGA